MMRAGFTLAALCLAGTAHAQVVLAPVWQDDAVIQRAAPVIVDGQAAAGEAITATLGAATASATADADGAFRLTFPARDASADPISLTVTGADGTSARAEGLVTGDVWLCSGQSNMEWSVASSTGAGAVIGFSADPLLRMMRVPQSTDVRPAKAFGAEAAWQKASPETTGGFSAVCYFMMRDLRAELDVPIGAVNASWGGSQIRAWLSPEGGAALYGAEQMARLEGFADNPAAAVTAFAPDYEEWWRAETGREPWNNPEGESWQPVPQISAWNEWAGTPLAENGNGNVMLRQTITLTAEQAAAGGTLGIGVIDDLDATWINGRPLGFTHGWSNERHYGVPADYLKAGVNEVLVIASNSWGAGGYTSTADRLFYKVEGGETIALGEGWQFSIGPREAAPPRAPWDANAGIGVMHNGMIAPLGGFAFKGAAWYQGESDEGIPGYAGRLRELFAGWRGQFGGDMRMLVVQLPNFGPVLSAPAEAGWADLREEQRKGVVADSNAALIPTLEAGDRNDLHPANKLPVGQRMAIGALGGDFPMPLKAYKKDWVYRIDFANISGGLESWSGAPVGFEICAETQESCRYATALAGGISVVLRDDGLPATRVRYAWADSPIVNTYDGRELPLPTFELEITP